MCCLDEDVDVSDDDYPQGPPPPPATPETTDSDEEAATPLPPPPPPPPYRLRQTPPPPYERGEGLIDNQLIIDTIIAMAEHMREVARRLTEVERVLNMA